MFVGIIPARYASTRLPAKPLADICGKTMIQRTYEQCLRAKLLDAVWVATDDQRIADHVHAFGGNAVLTSPHHPSGTDRCAQAVQLCCPQATAIVNIQGDEPFIDPNQIDTLAALLRQPNTALATLIRPITTIAELDDPSKPKVIIDAQGRAIYFSRHPIPYLRNHPAQQRLQHHTYYAHIGIYGYHTRTLQQITQLSPTPLEIAESLEQLRWLEHGYTIHTALSTHQSLSIDTPADLEHARTWLQQRTDL